MRKRPDRPPAWPSLLLLALWAAGSAAVAGQALGSWTASGARGPEAAAVAAALVVVALAEIAGLYYLLGFAAKAVSYLARPADRLDGREAGAPRPTVVLYLCAGDFDPVAVDSLLRLEGRGPRLFVLHDDGSDEAERDRMEAFVDRHPRREEWEAVVWHRPERRGGKAGAVNWVLERLEPRWELLLLCDSDSIALDPHALERATGEFDHPETAIVQFRNAGWVDPEDGALQRRLACAIDVFDAFATPMARWGYLPFFGHNAVLRLADVRRLGGLTPGFFSDDLDLSLRTTLAGGRIVYRPDVAFAERHPSNLSAFRKRARKWAFGCMQVVRARARAVLTTPGVPFAHRLGMLEFMGFYPVQALLLAGLLVSYLVLPWLAPAPAATPAFVAGGVLVALALLSPTLAWAVRARRVREWPGFAWACVLVYGGSIFATARGVLDGLSSRERPWIPTNLAARDARVPLTAWLESGLGAALFLVPWLRHRPESAFAAGYLFVAVFLYSPLTFLGYRENARDDGARESRPASRATRVPGAAVVLGFVLAATLLATSAPAAPVPRVRVDGARLLVNGAPLEVRGMHYSPWGPGTGPDGKSPYPDSASVARDLRSIRNAGANTVLIHEAPARVIRQAHAHGLFSIYAFDIAWNDTSRDAFDRQADAVVGAVDSLRREPGLIAWILGNEIPPWVVKELGAGRVEGRLHRLADRVRREDPDHPIGHGNWPPTKALDLSFLDLACFNLYPAWPYEVAVRGFGPYLREVLAPLAKGKPLLVTEFGINSLEAGEARQARVIADCWREIRHSPAIGGVVFEWSDEWWKNYDNPIPGQGYWQRRYDPGDAARHDADPEEYYGIVRADRTPKPALAAVRRMWHRRGTPWRAALPWLVLLGLGAGTWLALRSRARTTREPRRESSRLGAWTALLLVAALGLPGTARALALQADTLSGVQANSQFGWGLAGSGDLFGDGVGTTSVGARFYTTPGDTAAGAVYVFPGDRPPDSPAVLQLLGIVPHEHFGESLAGLADVDGDGLPDLAVGAPLRSTGVFSSNGAVDLFRGGSPGSRWVTLTGEASDDWFGQSVALGDLDGDGKAEIVVGAPYNDRGGSAAGAVFIYRGGSPPSSTPWLVLVGEASNDQFGWSVACVGDVNGDGYGDVLVGARLHGAGAYGAAGRAYLYLGGPSMDAVADGHWDGEAKDDWFGNSVAGPGDVDGGGRADLLVGAPYNDRAGSAAGAAYLFRGEDPPGSPPLVIYTGESADAQFGWTVGRAGDVNRDGFPDLVVGARLQASGLKSAAGRVYLFGGGTSPSATPLGTADGEAADDWFGNCVADAAGYFHAGGAAATAGAPYQDANASAAGRGYVLEPVSALAVPAPNPAVVPITFAPNPAFGAVRLVWRSRWAAGARFEVLDLGGRLIRSLVPVGDSGVSASATWDGRDRSGRPMPAAVYLVRFVSGRGASASPAVGRVVLLR